MDASIAYAWCGVQLLNQTPLRRPQRNTTQSHDAAAEEELATARLALSTAQEENETLRVKAAARPQVDVCGLWRAKGIDADGQEIDEAFVLSVSSDGRRIVGSHAPGSVRIHAWHQL